MNRLAPPAPQRPSVTLSALMLAPLILALGLASAYLSGSAADNAWFATLTKPALYPPPIAFPVVWTALYLLMGIALALVLAAPPTALRRAAVAAFVLQLALNLVWSPVFFGAHQLRAALALILAIDVALIATIVLFARVDRRAALLLAPYLAWTLFASGLAWQLVQDNPLVA